MDMRIVFAAAAAAALSFASNVAAQDNGPSALNTTEAELAKYAAARAACESLLADERAAIDTYDEANATGFGEQRKIDALETELTAKQLDPNPSDVTKQRIKELPKLLEGARTRLAEAAARKRAASGAEDRTYAKYMACLAQYIGPPTSVGSTDATAPATPVASPADTPSPAQVAPTDPNSPSGITPTDLTPSPSPSPGPLAPAAAPSVPIGLPASAPRQLGGLPAVWCVIQRTFTVIPGQNVNQASVARCDDVPGLGADWQPVQSNLTFPAANAIRDGINGANMPTVWCVMQRQGQNGPERTVIRCDNTTGAGPDWTLVDSNLTWPAATQEAFGTPSGGGQPFVPGVAGPPLAGPASTTPQAMGPVVGSQSGPSAAGPEELIDDLPRSTPRVGDSPECQQAQRSYEFARAEYPRVVLAITGQLQSFERILKVIEAADGGIPLELNEEGKANPDYGQWRSAGFMAVELREQLANAQDQMLSEQINVDRLCGFQIGNKWFPPKWRPGTPPSDNPPPLLPPSKTPPPKIAVNTPPKPPTNVTPTNPHSCTKYTCTYMEVTPPTSNYTVWDVCVPSGDWSRASCTFQWWDMAKLANNNTPDVNHPDGHDARDACQLPTVFGVTDHASFVKYCNAKFRGHVTEPEQSAQHADVALATPPDVAVDSPTKPAPPPDVAVDSPVKPATPPPPDVAIDSPRLATPPSPQSMPSHQPSLPNSEPGPEPAPPPTANSGAPSQPQINVYIPPAPPPEPGPPMVHDPHTPPVATSPLPSHQPAPPPIIDTFTPPKPPPPPTVYGQACSDPVNGVITCTDTEKRKCTTTSGTCDPRTGQVNPAPPKPSEPKTALPVTPLPPKTVEPTQPKPLPPKSVEPTQPKPLPPKTVEPTQPKPLPPKTVEPTQPQPLPAKTVEPTQPKPLPPKTAQAQPAIPPAPPPPSLPQQVAKVEPPPEPPDCTKAGGQFHVDRSEPLTIQQTSVGGSACRNRLTAGGTTHFTGVSISSQPSHGDVKQTGDYAFEYRPHKGFKGSDSYAVEVCGTSNAGSGCSIITYETTVE